MRSLARIPLDDGGSILFEAAPTIDGPVQAGRINEVIRDLPSSLRSTLGPVRETARAVMEQLRQAGPHQVVVEFGVDLATEAGVVITKSEASCHLTITLTWTSDAGTSDAP
ncbi:hypothetical protein Sru01_07020 [Sphaerisporangium rufum]|uniref:Trypsin-co-occurring domain-containing protein n=1 Tax=Sphaerisporangium rufum TaxID=1381558 RepID=A0A919V2X3_9ACTN|nr:CU044_2847 family protein [Sphaerisporangium rufum]GII75720.1 hypothetical protein Sru01_07020 [Sphaerisporangium rufum]